MDLKITQARLAGRSGLWDIGIEGDRISTVTPALSTPATVVIDAAQKLVIPGLVDGHIHLDKAMILDRHPAIEGTFQEAMQGTLQLKQTFTEADIQARARQVLQRAIAFGITAMRSHVEVDHTIGLTGLRALLPLRQEFAWGMTLQLAAFAQEGITNQPGVEALLREAMALGADVIGSAPYVDPDPEQNIRIVFDIAATFNCDVDFHLDFLDDDAPLLLPFVAAETGRRGWQGRVCLGHMTKLAGLPPAELADAAAVMRDAGVSILALPASDLYMMSRKDTHNVRRGVAPVHTLAAMGVNTGLAVNNVQNLFTPFGDGDVLKIGTLLAQVLQMGTAQAHELCLEMATTRAAKAIGLEDWAIAPGHHADLVILDATSATEAVAAAPINRTVIKRGRVVAQSKLEQMFFTKFGH
ncbi:MAG: amidohydrolase family protein [Cyanobacteria bacterium J069]